MHVASNFNKLDIVKILCSKMKSDVNLKNKDGYSPLHIALWASNEEIALYLLDKGADAELETTTH